ncbi:MAG: hypothetical protein E7384_00890 [Ruminococcaceae bacterium]|nr:hypothetical protein [Oscillospiraceae bacterium]
MSETNSNEKRNNAERENRDANCGHNGNRRNNGYKKYHQRRPYPKNNDRGQNVSADSKNGAEKKDETNVNGSQTRPLPKKTGESFGEGGKNFSGNQRQRDFIKKKNHHVRVEETVEDIDIDIGRIEKEIELEIKEISAFKFGL